MNRREFGTIGLAFGLTALAPRPLRAADWQKLPDGAKGQTGWFHACGSDPKINDFITWLGQITKARQGVKITQVKLAATADAVARVQAEPTAGIRQSAVDLIWINGENFAAMQEKALLLRPFTADLPNGPLVDVSGKPATVTDFTKPIRGFESRWAMAQPGIEVDSARAPQPPLTPRFKLMLPIPQCRAFRPCWPQIVPGFQIVPAADRAGRTAGAAAGRALRQAGHRPSPANSSAGFRKHQGAAGDPCHPRCRRRARRKTPRLDAHGHSGATLTRNFLYLLTILACLGSDKSPPARPPAPIILPEYPLGPRAGPQTLGPITAPESNPPSVRPAADCRPAATSRHAPVPHPR